MSNEEIKPNHSMHGEYITLKVHGQDEDEDEDEVILKIRRSTPLKVLLNVYCECQSVDHDSFIFIFDGHHLRGEKTPDELEMEDGDEIYAMPHHDGAQSAMVGITISNQDTKPPSEYGYITLKVIKGLDGNELFFRIKRSTRLMKLMNRYCEHHSVDHGSFGFIFHGRRIRGEQTPDELALEEGDQIHALMIKKGC